MWHWPDYSITLHYILCIEMHYIIKSYCIILHYIAFQSIWYWPIWILHYICNMLHYIAVYCSILHHFALYIAIYCNIYCTILPNILYYIAIYIALYIALYCIPGKHTQGILEAVRALHPVWPANPLQLHWIQTNINKKIFANIIILLTIFLKFNIARPDKEGPGKRQLRSPDEKGPMHPEAGGGGGWQRIAPPSW